VSKAGQKWLCGHLVRKSFKGHGSGDEGKKEVGVRAKSMDFISREEVK